MQKALKEYLLKYDIYIYLKKSYDCLTVGISYGNIFQGRNSQLAVYFSAWYEESPKEIIFKKLMIQRCQRIPKIFVSGFMSVLNREYCFSVSAGYSNYFFHSLMWRIDVIIKSTCN